MGLAAFNRLRREHAREAAKESQPELEADGQGETAPSDKSEQEYRSRLMDAIEHASGKRPGANTKTETLEQRLAELEADGQGEQPEE